MLKAILLLLLLLLVTPTHERWAVKTATDGVHTTVATKSTVAKQNALARPTGSWLTLPRQADESMIEIHGTIIAIGLEADKDYHLVLQDGSATMICEIPAPVGPYTKQFTTCRNWCDHTFGKPHGIKSVTPTQVTITGFGFFDKIAHGKGHAANGREIHPCISIQ